MRVAVIIGTNFVFDSETLQSDLPANREMIANYMASMFTRFGTLNDRLTFAGARPQERIFNYLKHPSERKEGEPIYNDVVQCSAMPAIAPISALNYKIDSQGLPLSEDYFSALPIEVSDVEINLTGGVDALTVFGKSDVAQVASQATRIKSRRLTSPLLVFAGQKKDEKGSMVFTVYTLGGSHVTSVKSASTGVMLTQMYSHLGIHADMDEHSRVVDWINRSINCFPLTPDVATNGLTVRFDLALSFDISFQPNQANQADILSSPSTFLEIEVPIPSNVQDPEALVSSYSRDSPYLFASKHSRMTSVIGIPVHLFKDAIAKDGVFSEQARGPYGAGMEHTIIGGPATTFKILHSCYVMVADQAALLRESHLLNYSTSI